MSFTKTNRRIIATYGVGSGNAPALSYKSVGHLRVAFFSFPKSYKLCLQIRSREPLFL